MKTAIVTGAFGYIGSVLCKLLKENDYYVYGIDNRAFYPKEAHRIKYCDYFVNSDFTSLKQSLQYYPSGTVFHLAANSLLGPSAYDPLSYFANNSSKTVALLDFLARNHKVVFASTAAVYEQSKAVKTENSPLAPPNNYGMSKLWCEQAIDSCFEIKQMKATTFRFFNVIGSYGDVGQEKKTPHVVNQLCDAAYTGTPFKMYGSDWDTRDGSCVRDYVHVVDVCRAMIHADQYMDTVHGPMHQKFNLGTSKGTSVLELVNTFSDVVKPIDVQVVERRKGDPAYLIADPSKFVDVTGFEYEYGERKLNEMIESAWSYYNAF